MTIVTPLARYLIENPGLCDVEVMINLNEEGQPVFDTLA